MEIAFKARRSIDCGNRWRGVTPTNRRVIAIALVLGLASVSTSQGNGAEAPPKDAAAKPVDVADWRQVPDLLQRLRRGGLVVYFRHAATDRSHMDQKPVDLSDCAKQRNLSDEGRRQSQIIGEAFRTLGIPLGPILSSPYCRAMDTARLAFGRVEKSDGLYYALGLSAAEKSKTEAVLRKLLSEPRSADGNLIVVSHTANLRDAAKIWPKPEGTAIVFEPRGAEGFKAIARIEPDDWTRIVATSKAGN